MAIIVIDAVRKVYFWYLCANGSLLIEDITLVSNCVHRIPDRCVKFWNFVNRIHIHRTCVNKTR
jgi:hypothetical protein